MTVRAYVPTTLRLLSEARERGSFGPAPVAAHAVTPTLRALAEGAGETGEEELEWAASVAASLDSVRLLTDEEEPRRVVAAVDVPQVEPGEHPGEQDVPSAVVLREVPLRRLAALLVDAPDAAPLVAAARVVLAGGAPEDDPAVERCLEEELGWWAASELGVLLDP